MLAIVFNDEKSAYEGARALAELKTEGSIDVFAAAVLQKDAQGWVATKKVKVISRFRPSPAPLWAV